MKYNILKKIKIKIKKKIKHRITYLNHQQQQKKRIKELSRIDSQTMYIMCVGLIFLIFSSFTELMIKMKFENLKRKCKFLRGTTKKLGSIRNRQQFVLIDNYFILMLNILLIEYVFHEEILRNLDI